MIVGENRHPTHICIKTEPIKFVRSVNSKINLALEIDNLAKITIIV